MSRALWTLILALFAISVAKAVLAANPSRVQWAAKWGIQIPSGGYGLTETVDVAPRENPKPEADWYFQQGGVFAGRGPLHSMNDKTYGKVCTRLYAMPGFDGDAALRLGGVHATVKDLALQSNPYKRDFTAANVGCGVQIEDFIDGTGGGSHTIDNVVLEAFRVGLSFGQPNTYPPQVKGNGDNCRLPFVGFYNNAIDFQVNSTQSVGITLDHATHYGPFRDGKVDYDLRTAGDLKVGFYHKAGPGTMLRIWTGNQNNMGRSAGNVVVDGGKVDNGSFNRRDFKILDMGDFRDPDNVARKGSTQVVVTVNDLKIGDLRLMDDAEKDPPWVTTVGRTAFNWNRGARTLVLPRGMIAWHEVVDTATHTPVFRFRDCVVPRSPTDLADVAASTGRCYLMHSGCVDKDNTPIPPATLLWDGERWLNAFTVAPKAELLRKPRPLCETLSVVSE